ncbi:MAG TPA: hypothetical protein VHW00_10890 [Thermoanaerobaculia bacterium]|nr:hypothetical protein [Thermoanaerobaculia bacterium]
MCAAVILAIALPATAAVKFTSNSIKYRDSGTKPATGRSGSATLQARALVDKEQHTELQLTTGSFDPAESRGNIDKVQLKSESSGTINDHRLSNDGTYAVMLDNVGRGEVVGVTAHVSGIDGRRVDVVSLETTAKLRPDLQVTSVQAPSNIVVGTPAMISAVIREANGDVGARATCVLKVNGVTVDSASDIWVDAGGVVSCSFLNTFGSAGNANVEVSLRNVEPGDYDDASNRLSITVNVLSDVQHMPRWGAAAGESEWYSKSEMHATWGYHNETLQAGWEHYTAFSALWDEPLDLATMKATYVEKHDGVTIVEERDMPLVRNDDYYMGSSRAQCLTRITEDFTAAICQRGEIDMGDYVKPAFINPQFERRAGDITYFSREWSDAPDDQWVKNDSGRSTYGDPRRLGRRISLEVEVSDATHRFGEHPHFEIDERSEERSTQPVYCYNSYWCRGWDYWRINTWGGVSSDQ